MISRGWRISGTAILIAIIVTALGIALETALQETHTRDCTILASLGVIRPGGATDLVYSVNRVSSWPPPVGSYVIKAKGIHTSWTNVPVFAISVTGGLQMTVGGEEYEDEDDAGEFNDDEIEVTTYVESQRVAFTMLADLSIEGTSLHEFFDPALGGWVSFTTTARFEL